MAENTEEKKMPRAQKVELGVIISLIGLIIVISMNLISYGRGDEGAKKDILILRRDVDRALSNSEKIPVIETDVKYLRQSSDAMQKQVQTLIDRR